MSDTILDALGSGGEDINRAEVMHGVVPAIVSNIKDEKKLGRIKVNFPWLAENSESDWVRVASPYAGDARGSFFLPEVGDEVLVIFQKGNINAPYVIGSLWSNKAKPPEENADGKNNIKVFKSRAGHTLTFDDAEGKENLVIKSKSGHTITLDDASGSESIEIKDKAGSNKITIDSVTNNISVECSMDLSFKATNVNIEASAQLNLKCALLKAEASGIAEIKGAMVKIN
ncbi:MAG: phage tail protein [bacterium]|nr:phage tail protein [bacterium]